MSYFDRFPRFMPDPNAPVLEEFHALAILMEWQPGTKKFKKQMRQCLTREAQAYVGTADRLTALQDLCEELDVEDIPSSITQCKKALSRFNVNIVDLLDSRRTGAVVRTFHHRAALREYTKRTKKFFPREIAKAGGALSALLIFMD